MDQFADYLGHHVVRHLTSVTRPDVTRAHALDSQWTGQHFMAVNGRRTRITRANVREVGDRFSVPSAFAIVEQVLDAVAKWVNLHGPSRSAEATTDHITGDIEVWSSPRR